MTRTARILGAMIIALALASPAFAGGDHAHGADHHHKATDFTLADQHGKEVSLSDFAGKTVVLEWINPDCPFVQRHYKSDTMTNLAAKWGEKEVVWLAINSTHYMGAEDNLKFAMAHGIEYPILADPTGEVGRAYEAVTTPHMYVIDGEGNIVYNGAIDDDKRGSSKSPKNYVDAALASATGGSAVEEANTKPYGCSVKYADKAKAKAKASSR